MYDFYRTKINEDALKESRKKLRNLYSNIPETKGCMENIAKENGCGARCCQNQTPQVMYVEFLNTWNSILNGRTASEVASLVIRAVRTYLSDNPIRGCIMWNKQTKLCNIHTTRPSNCRVYSQIPEEEFKPRFERLKILYQNVPSAAIMNQCDLTETIGQKPTVEDTNNWQKELEEIEESIGVPKPLITDLDGGSYRTFHDHILLRLCGLGFWKKASDIRVNGTREDKDKFIQSLVDTMRKANPYLEDTQDQNAPSKIILES